MNFLYRKSKSKYRICLFVLLAFLFQIGFAGTLPATWADFDIAAESTADATATNDADATGTDDSTDSDNNADDGAVGDAADADTNSSGDLSDVTENDGELDGNGNHSDATNPTETDPAPGSSEGQQDENSGETDNNAAKPGENSGEPKDEDAQPNEDQQDTSNPLQGGGGTPNQPGEETKPPVTEEPQPGLDEPEDVTQGKPGAGSQQTPKNPVTTNEAPDNSSGTDVTDKLKDFKLEVKQESKVIKETDKIDSTKPISVKISFQVPVIGDGGNDYVNLNDFASFCIAKGFKLTSTAKFDLEHDNVKVGTLTITTDDSTKEMSAYVVFDGDEDVFTGSVVNWSGVGCQFNATLEYDGTGDAASEGDHEVTLLEKTFIVNVPAIPVIITGEKTGERDGQFIDWKVKVTAKKGTEDGDFSGYKFVDDLTEVGKYVSGTFKIGESKYADKAQEPDESDFSYNDNDNNKVIEYTFPQDTKGERYIFFRTEILEGDLYSNTNKTISNTAQVLNGAKIEWSGSGSVEFDSKWIVKTAEKDYTSGVNEGKITWTIIANHMGATLEEVVIIDKLDEKVEFESAQLSIGDETLTNWEDPNTIKPNAQHEYTLENISTPVKLVITAKVKDDVHNIGHEVQTVTNEATIKWDKKPVGIKSNVVATEIGLNPIKKTAGSYNPSTHTIPWTVTVSKSDVDDDLRVLDLLVYGTNGSFKAEEDYTINGNATNGLKHVSIEDIEKLKPSYNLKFEKNSFYGVSEGLETTVYELQKDGKVVADLIVVTGTNGAGINVSSGSKSFSYRTIVTDQAIFANNGTKYVDNTATLFSGVTRLNEDKATATCTSNMITNSTFTEPKTPLSQT